VREIKIAKWRKHSRTRRRRGLLLQSKIRKPQKDISRECNGERRSGRRRNTPWEKIKKNIKQKQEKNRSSSGISKKYKERYNKFNIITNQTPQLMYKLLV
jgi:hypothetical protein